MRMKAALCDRYGPPEVIRVDEVDRPDPKPGEVLVRVVASSVNRADLDGLVPRPQFARLYVGFRAPRNPRIGVDVAGVVESVGDEVTRFRPGDQVIGDMFLARGQGAFAEYVSVPERALAPMPDGLPFDAAATLPHSAVLALQGLRLRNGRTIKPGDKVLIDGASGSVGPFAVQIAKARGAEVTGAARGSKLDFVRSLGADHVLDYEQVDYTTTGQRYDWIVDTDFHHSLRGVRRALKPDGVYLSLGGRDRQIVTSMVLGSLASLGSRKKSMLMWWKPLHAPDLETLEGLMADGKLRPVIDRRYPLDQVVDALRWVHDGHARGKVVLTIQPPG